MKDDVLEVTAQQLREDPRAFHGRRVRFRDIVHHRFEGMSVADAWWTQTGGDVGFGVHLADVEGDWIASGEGRGHMSGWPAELRGTAYLASFEAPTTIDEAMLATAPELTPLEVHATAQALMQRWFCQGLELWRLGTDARMPAIEAPRLQPIRAVVCRDGGRLYVASFELVGEARPIEPRRVAPESLATIRGAQLIEVEGLLAAGAPYPFPGREGAPAHVNWPRLEGCIDVVLPETPASLRYTVPSSDGPGMARWLALLAEGPRRVRARGELWVFVEAGRRHAMLWATELEPI